MVVALAREASTRLQIRVQTEGVHRLLEREASMNFVINRLAISAWVLAVGGTVYAQGAGGGAGAGAGANDAGAGGGTGLKLSTPGGTGLRPTGSAGTAPATSAASSPSALDSTGGNHPSVSKSDRSPSGESANPNGVKKPY
jgi:hypothetical protein